MTKCKACYYSPQDKTKEISGKFDANNEWMEDPNELKYYYKNHIFVPYYHTSKTDEYCVLVFYQKQLNEDFKTIIKALVLTSGSSCLEASQNAYESIFVKPKNED